LLLESKNKDRLYSALSALSSAISPSRLGTAAPAAAAPLSGSPAGRNGKAPSGSTRALRRSLRAGTAEGVVSEVVSACVGGAVLTGWALYLNASPTVLGLVLALSQLAQLFQIPAAWTTSLLGRRRACIALVGLSRQAMLPLCALPFLPLSDASRQGVLIGVAALSSVLSVLGNNAWVAWMSDLVPQRVRGRYFGRRSALCTLGGALAAAGVGLVLDHARAHQLEGTALALLQVAGSLCGLVTTALMFRQHDPRPEHTRVRLSWSRVSAPLRDPAARALCVYLVAWNAAVGLAGSFFTLHMLKNLELGFTLIALHGTSVALVRMVAAPLWGGLLDRLGARPVLIACSFAICVVPLVWLFPTPTSLWPLAVDAVVAGVLWSGHALAIFNLQLAITPRPERPFYLAVFATLAGLSFSVATVAGGLLVDALPDRFTLLGFSLCDLHVMFALSGLFRLAAAFTSLRIREPAAKSVPALYDALLGKLRPAVLRPVRLVALGRVARAARAANDNDAASTPEQEPVGSASAG